MTTSFSTIGRTFAAVIAVAVFVSLALQVSINEEPGRSAIGAFGLMLRFFTIWTNLAVGIVMGWIALKGDANPRVLFALATAITIVASVYHLVLAGDHHPVGLDWWTNQMFHTVIPLATIAWWLGFSRPSIIGWRSVPVVMIWPILYTGFALIHGAITGFYAYFFLDLPALGWGQLLVNMAGLSILFMLIGAVLLGLRGLLARATG